MPRHLIIEECEPPTLNPKNRNEPWIYQASGRFYLLSRVDDSLWSAINLQTGNRYGDPSGSIDDAVDGLKFYGRLSFVEESPASPAEVQAASPLTITITPKSGLMDFQVAISHKG